METLYQVLGIVGAALIVWLIYSNIKNRPDLFSRENISKSFSSMGVLALLLIGFVALLIFMVRYT